MRRASDECFSACACARSSCTVLSCDSRTCRYQIGGIIQMHLRLHHNLFRHDATTRSKSRVAMRLIRHKSDSVNNLMCTDFESRNPPSFSPSPHQRIRCASTTSPPPSSPRRCQLLLVSKSSGGTSHMCKVQAQMASSNVALLALMERGRKCYMECFEFF